MCYWIINYGVVTVIDCITPVIGYFSITAHTVVFFVFFLKYKPPKNGGRLVGQSVCLSVYKFWREFTRSGRRWSQAMMTNVND